MTKITDQEFVEAIAKYRTSRRKNPLLRHPGGCAYTVLGTRWCHCIVGQIMVDLGLELPPVGDRHNRNPVGLLSSGYTNRFRAWQLRWLMKAQVEADRKVEADRNQTEWREAIRVANRYVEQNGIYIDLNSPAGPIVEGRWGRRTRP